MSRGKSLLAVLNDRVYRYGDYDKMATAMTLGLDSYFRTSYISLIPCRDKLIVLDLGAGTGLNTAYVLQHCGSAWIVLADISLSGLRIAWTRLRDDPRVDLVCTSAELLSFRARVFNVVLSSYMLRHVDIKTVCVQVARVIRRPGLILMVDFWKSHRGVYALLLTLHLALLVPLLAMLFSPRTWREYARIWREFVRLPDVVYVTKIFRKAFNKVSLRTFNNFVFVWVITR